MLGLVCHIGTKVPSNNAMPGRVVFLVKFLLDEGRDVFLDVEFLHRLSGIVYGILLHVLWHVSILYDCFSFRHLAKKRGITQRFRILPREALRTTPFWRGNRAWSPSKCGYLPTSARNSFPQFPQNFATEKPLLKQIKLKHFFLATVFQVSDLYALPEITRASRALSTVIRPNLVPFLGVLYQTSIPSERIPSSCP